MEGKTIAEAITNLKKTKENLADILALCQEKLKMDWPEFIQTLADLDQEIMLLFMPEGILIYESPQETPLSYYSLVLKTYLSNFV